MSSDPETVRGWWRRWPQALIGMLTGSVNGAVVLDIDVREDKDGRETLKALGFAELPITPTVRTASGGLHLYFAIPEGGLRNTAG